jgi:hypothetical protein
MHALYQSDYALRQAASVAGERLFFGISRPFRPSPSSSRARSDARHVDALLVDAARLGAGV